VPLVAPRDLAVTVPAGLTLNSSMHVKVRYNGPIKAPIKAGDEIAQLVVTTADTQPQIVPLVAGTDVGQAGFFGRAWYGLMSLFGLA
jgi:D-alanyl-D-alanine carboxypeptidase (penicillin-binding protein 5/6)